MYDATHKRVSQDFESMCSFTIGKVELDVLWKQHNWLVQTVNDARLLLFLERDDEL